jgi:hypothetical protein
MIDSALGTVGFESPLWRQSGAVPQVVLPSAGLMDRVTRGGRFTVRGPGGASPKGVFAPRWPGSSAPFPGSIQ